MRQLRSTLVLLTTATLLLKQTPWAFAQSAPAEPFRLDFRFAPPDWQTSICLPDDWQKTLVGKDGALLYDYPGPYSGFGTRLQVGLSTPTHWVGQRLLDPRIPVVQTTIGAGAVEVVQEAFAVPQSGLGKLEPSGQERSNAQTRNDVLLVRFHNTASQPVSFAPTLTIESRSAIDARDNQKSVRIGEAMTVWAPVKPASAEPSDHKLVLTYPKLTLEPDGSTTLAFGIARGNQSTDLRVDLGQAEALRKAAVEFWQAAPLPYEHLQVPDAAVQALLDSAVRNIYQAREIKKGLPAFQVGPTCYRGLWVVDGSFLLEAITYLGRTNETRNGIQYLLTFQRDDGGIMLIDGHWKETGIALWAVTRHARLTGDRAWLEDVWPRVERGFNYIHIMREMASRQTNAPNYDLIPDGFSDGGLADKVPEYTNIYWTLVGMRAAVEAALWLGHNSQAENWQQQYDDFYAAFRRAAERDLRSDSQGNRYLPIRMAKGEGILPQKAQWGFLHSVYPGQLYRPSDPLVQGNMAMLRSVEKEGLVLDTGWLKEGIWNYFGSFYAHAWLWLGDGEKAARTLYAFGNHASPLLAWREEQKPLGQGNQVVGDMPHNWASAEFIRLVRHSLVLERGSELHLLEALPSSWVKAGAVTRVNHILTEFGDVSFALRVSADGTQAQLSLNPPTRTPPSRIILHLNSWSGQQGSLELPTKGAIEKTIRLGSAWSPSS